MSSQQPQKNIDLRGVAIMGTEIGFVIAIPLIACILSGIYIDKILSTSPAVTILSVFAGIWLVYVDMKYLIIPILEKKKR